MPKTAGMGDNYYVGGFDLSGLTQSLSNMHGGPNSTQDSTDITQSGVSRLGLERDGGLGWVSYWDPTGAAHILLSALPVADNIATYCRGTAIGNPALSCNSKLIGYDPNRGQDGSLTLAVQAQANGFGAEWGTQLTAGKRTDTTPTAGPFFDNLAAFNFGAQAYLQVFSMTGTDATVKIQHATTSGGAYSDLITFPQIISGNLPPLAARASIANNVTVNEFLKVTTVTTGGFSNLVFAVAISVNSIAAVVF